MHTIIFPAVYSIVAIVMYTHANELLGIHILVSFQIGLECLSHVAFPLTESEESE